MHAVTSVHESPCTQSSVSVGLRRESLTDADTDRKPARRVAFGSAVPARPKPPRKQTYKRCLDCPTVPKDLVSMQVVWEGITRLR